jgi:hypothetical protein
MDSSDGKETVTFRLTRGLKEKTRQFTREEWGSCGYGLLSATIEKFIIEGLARKNTSHTHTNSQNMKKVKTEEMKAEEMKAEADNAIVLSNNGESITTSLADNYLDKITTEKHRRHMVKISVILAYLRKENKLGLIEGNEALVYRMDFIKAMQVVYPRCTDGRTLDKHLGILLTEGEIEVVPGKGLTVFRIIHMDEIADIT